MNIKEISIPRIDRIVPTPSAAWKGYIQSVRNGMEEKTPVYGQGERVIFDYYGLNKKKSVEQGRIRIPLQNNDLEISYHITKTPDGIFHSVYEGIFPFAD